MEAAVCKLTYSKSNRREAVCGVLVSFCTIMELCCSHINLLEGCIYSFSAFYVFLRSVPNQQLHPLRDKSRINIQLTVQLHGHKSNPPCFHPHTVGYSPINPSDLWRSCELEAPSHSPPPSHLLTSDSTPRLSANLCWPCETFTIFGYF